MPSELRSCHTCWAQGEAAACAVDPTTPPPALCAASAHSHCRVSQQAAPVRYVGDNEIRHACSRRPKPQLVEASYSAPAPHSRALSRSADHSAGCAPLPGRPPSLPATSTSIPAAPASSSSSAPSFDAAAAATAGWPPAAAAAASARKSSLRSCGIQCCRGDRSTDGLASMNWCSSGSTPEANCASAGKPCTVGNARHSSSQAWEQALLLVPASGCLRSPPGLPPCPR